MNYSYVFTQRLEEKICRCLKRFPTELFLNLTGPKFLVMTLQFCIISL